MNKFAIEKSTAIMSARKQKKNDDNNQTKQQREKEAKWKCAKLVKLKFASNLGRFDIFYATMRIRAANSLIVTTISAECFAASHLMCMIVDYMCIQHRTESVTLFHSFIPLFFLFSLLFCLLSLSLLFPYRSSFVYFEIRAYVMLMCANKMCLFFNSFGLVL